MKSHLRFSSVSILLHLYCQLYILRPPFNSTGFTHFPFCTRYRNPILCPFVLPASSKILIGILCYYALETFQPFSHSKYPFWYRPQLLCFLATNALFWMDLLKYLIEVRALYFVRGIKRTKFLEIYYHISLTISPESKARACGGNESPWTPCFTYNKNLKLYNKY